MKRTILSLVMGIALSTSLPALAGHNKHKSHHGKSPQTQVIPHNRHKHKHITRPNDSIACLTANIINEAGGEKPEGKKSVAAVTLNRLLSGRFGRTICDVVYQKSQFSWVGRKSGFVTNPTARKIAEEYIRHYHKGMDPTMGATHFHSGRFPGWRGVVKTKRIGGHTFYRMPGVKIAYNDIAVEKPAIMLAQVEPKKENTYENISFFSFLGI